MASVTWEPRVGEVAAWLLTLAAGSPVVAWSICLAPALFVFREKVGLFNTRGRPGPGAAGGDLQLPASQGGLGEFVPPPSPRAPKEASSIPPAASAAEATPGGASWPPKPPKKLSGAEKEIMESRMRELEGLEFM